MTQPPIPHVVRRYENNEWETAVDEYGGGGGGASGGAQIYSGILTAAEIRSCYSSPVEVLPAVPGQAYVVFCAAWIVTAGTTGHTNNSAADIAFNSGSSVTPNANLGFLLALSGTKTQLTNPAGGWGSNSEASNASDLVAYHDGQGIVLASWAAITGTGDLDIRYTFAYFMMPTA